MTREEKKSGRTVVVGRRDEIWIKVLLGSAADVRTTEHNTTGGLLLASPVSRVVQQRAARTATMTARQHVVASEDASNGRNKL